MMGKRSRTKGAAYENYVARKLRDAGFNAKRHLEYQSEEAIAGRDLDGTYPFAIQIKCWKKCPPATVIEEVVTGDGYKYRMAVLKRTRSPGVPTLEVAVVDLDVMLRMMMLLESNGLLEKL